MGLKVLVIGESGTGKTTSLRNLNPDKTAIVNPVGKPLPFRTQFKQQIKATNKASDICAFMVDSVKHGCTTIVVDDFQYILSIPYMKRIKEAGWDKWNDFGSNYYDILDCVDSLPDNVVVYFLSHCENVDGITQIKLIGKMLREKITIEGLFTIVLRTAVSDGQYVFLTQNSGADTCKSPMGMFESYAIDNDLNYVDAVIRNFYYMDDAVGDSVIDDLSKMKAVEGIEKGGEKKRTRRGSNRTEAAPSVVAEAIVEAPKSTEIDTFAEDPFEDIDKVKEARAEEAVEAVKATTKRTRKTRS